VVSAGKVDAAMYKLKIQPHARERWVERVVDYNRYSHLEGCKTPNCEKCRSLIGDIRYIIQTLKSRLDSQILAAFMDAKEADRRVTDYNFLKTVEKRYDSARYDFWELRSGHVFVTTNDEIPPALITVLRREQLDGTVIRDSSPAELKQAFKRWQFEARQRKQGG
jgi:hypothetical protein